MRTTVLCSVRKKNFASKRARLRIYVCLSHNIIILFIHHLICRGRALGRTELRLKSSLNIPGSIPTDLSLNIPGSIHLKKERYSNLKNYQDLICHANLWLAVIRFYLKGGSLAFFILILHTKAFAYIISGSTLFKWLLLVLPICYRHWQNVPTILHELITSFFREVVNFLVFFIGQ